MLEYVNGGELYDHIVNKGRLREWQAVRFFRQIIAGVSYCHSFNICHRDLKLENILLDENCNVKIADFGFAALQPPDRLLQTACGTPHYVAPEVAKAHDYYGPLADVWSCGIILFIFLTGYQPFDDDDVNQLLDKVRHGKFAMPKEMSWEAKDLIKRMLQPNPKRRISLDKVWEHPLIKKHTHVTLADGSVEYFATRPVVPSIYELDQPRTRREIDMEILQNLQSLWHGEGRDVIVERLLNDE